MARKVTSDTKPKPKAKRPARVKTETSVVTGEETADMLDSGQAKEPYPPRLIDVPKALKLRVVHKLSYAEIAQRFGVSKQAVHDRLSKISNLLEDPELTGGYRENKSDILEAAQMRMVNEMLDPGKIEKASVNNLAYAAGQLDNMIRLERGQSTSNIATYEVLSREEAAIDAELEQLQERLAVIDTRDTLEAVDQNEGVYHDLVI